MHSGHHSGTLLGMGKKDIISEPKEIPGDSLSNGGVKEENNTLNIN